MAPDLHKHPGRQNRRANCTYRRDIGTRLINDEFRKVEALGLLE